MIGCDLAIDFLCQMAEKAPFLCDGFHSFALNVERKEYCDASFAETSDKRICTRVLDAVAAGTGHCEGSLSRFLIKELAAYDTDLGLLRRTKD